MKKIMLLLCFVAFTTVFVQAQGGQGGGGGRMNEMLKQRLKDDLKFSDVKTDSVLAVQTDFQMKSRAVRMDENLNDDQKKAKMDVLNAERTARLKNSLSEDEIKKLDAMYEEMRKNRQRPQN